MIIALVFSHKNSSLLNFMNEVLARPQPKLILQAHNAEDSDDDDDDLPALIHLKHSPIYSQDWAKLN